MSQRFQGMLIGLLLIGGALLLFNNKNEKVIDNGDSPVGNKSQASTGIICEPGNCGPRCGSHVRSAQELRNSRITCRPNDSNCIEKVGDPCPQEIVFAEFRSGQKTKILSFWLAIYDNLDSFLEKYDTPACRKRWNACMEMFNTQLLQIDERPIEDLAKQWNSLLKEADPYLIGDTAGELESMYLVFAPILTHLQWIVRNNQTTYKEYMNDVIPMLRGMQNAIKYELLHQFVGEQGKLPWKFHPSYEDFNE